MPIELPNIGFFNDDQRNAITLKFTVISKSGFVSGAAGPIYP